MRIAYTGSRALLPPPGEQIEYDKEVTRTVREGGGMGARVEKVRRSRSRERRRESAGERMRGKERPSRRRC